MLVFTDPILKKVLYTLINFFFILYQNSGFNYHLQTDSFKISKMTSSTPPHMQAPHTTSYIFTAKLYERQIINTTPRTLRVVCQHRNCSYTMIHPWKITSSGNLYQHYRAHHPAVPLSEIDVKAQSNSNFASSRAHSTTDFFSKKRKRDEPERILSTETVRGEAICRGTGVLRSCRKYLRRQR
jgi:hypothetical protein